MKKNTQVDIVIVGGSFAGLSSAMALGRSRRNVLIIDSGKPCNAQTPQAHNLIGHDGEAPSAITKKALEQVLHYPTVKLVAGNVVNITGESGKFRVVTEDGDEYQASKILLATGVRDIPLPIPGFAECWGISVLHCPYCHGYEVRDEPLGIIANGDIGFDFAGLIHHWSQQLSVFTNGTSSFSLEQRTRLNAHNIQIVETPISAIVHESGLLTHVEFQDQTRIPLKAIFARAESVQHSSIPENLGCTIYSEGHTKGLIQVNELGMTTVPGVYAAGDNSSPMRSLAAAIGMGSIAGAALNRELIKESF